MMMMLHSGSARESKKRKNRSLSGLIDSDDDLSGDNSEANDDLVYGSLGTSAGRPSEAAIEYDPSAIVSSFGDGVDIDKLLRQFGLDLGDIGDADGSTNDQQADGDAPAPPTQVDFLTGSRAERRRAARAGRRSEEASMAERRRKLREAGRAARAEALRVRGGGQRQHLHPGDFGVQVVG